MEVELKVRFTRNEDGELEKTALTSMNDKCASGTGATIDKCMIKVGMPAETVSKILFDPTKLHHVAAKCGVFAETDIVNLVKSGIPSAEIMCSLADAIVMQNLSVLTRGNTLKDRVLLLGGPNTYLPFLQECWRLRIPETWESRRHEYDRSLSVEELVFVPDNSQYYAAYGAVLYGLHEPAGVGDFVGLEGLRAFIDHGRQAKLGESAGPALIADQSELSAFQETYRTPHFESATFAPGQVVRGVIGLDGGSTSSKCVLVDEEGTILEGEGPVQGAAVALHGPVHLEKGPRARVIFHTHQPWLTALACIKFGGLRMFHPEASIYEHRVGFDPVPP